MSSNLIALVASLAIAVAALGWLALQGLGRFANAQSERVRETAENELADMFVFVDYRRLVWVNFAGFVLVPVVVWFVTSNPLLTLLGLAFPVFAPKLVTGFIRKRRMRMIRKQLPDMLTMMSSSMRAGASLMTTLENLVREGKPPLAQEIGLLLRDQRLGVDFTDSLNRLEERVPLQEVYLFSAGVQISRETGGNLSEMLDSLADTITRSLTTEGKISSLTSQGKAQGFVMAGLPLLMIVALNALQPKQMAPLFHTVDGWITLAVIAVMEIMGYIGIRKITNIDV